MAIEIIVDAATGKITERELTAEELAELKETTEQKTARLRAEIEQIRRGAYIAEADPLYFGWQRNENTEQEWLDKIAEIRARHPYS